MYRIFVYKILDNLKIDFTYCYENPRIAPSHLGTVASLKLIIQCF